MAEETDLYAILCISPIATPRDIKAAYRRLAVANHPDKNPDPSAHAAFIRISEAYQVLIDPKRRLAYDRAKKWEREAPFDSVEADEVFGNFFAGAGGGWGTPVFDAYRTTEEHTTNINNLFGCSDILTNRKKGTEVTTRTISLTFAELWSGVWKEIVVSRYLLNQKEKKYEMQESVLGIDVPAGCRPKREFVYRGYGPEKTGSGGDLLVRVEMLPHPHIFFSAEADGRQTLHYRAQIPSAEGALDKTIEIRLPGGVIKVAPTADGLKTKRQVLRGEGLVYGDLVVVWDAAMSECVVPVEDISK